MSAQITIDYLGHSGFLAETAGCLLLFDYYRGDLSVLEEKPADKPLYVFVSHVHGDHFNPQILKLDDGSRPVRFVFSFDLEGNVPFVPGARKGSFENARTGSGESGIMFLEADRTYRISVTGDAGITVETLLSNDEGVAFLVDTGDAVLYHAGDLHWWNWEGEDPEWLAREERIYKTELEKLRGRRIDAAFVVLDDRLEDNYAQGLKYLLSVCSPRYVLPMHFWEDMAVIDRFRAEHPEPERPEGVNREADRNPEGAYSGPNGCCTQILDTVKENHWELD